MKTVLTGNTNKTQEIPTISSTDTEEQGDSIKPVKDCDLSVINTDKTVPADNPVKDEPITENKMHSKIPKLEPKLESDQVATLKTLKVEQLYELWKAPEEVRKMKVENFTNPTVCNISAEQLNPCPPMPTPFNMQGQPVIKGEQSDDENTYLDPSTLIPIPFNMQNDTAIKGEPSEDERTYTVLDPQLVKTLNKPKPKRVVKRIRSKQQVAKKRTHPKKIKTIKCTPIDRNINATQKLLFQQLRNIKLEIKLEPLSKESPAGPHSHKTTTALKAKKNKENTCYKSRSPRELANT